MSAEDRVASLARTKAGLEADLLETSLDLRRASEDYEALAAAFRASAERLREAAGAVSAAHHEREELVRVVASLQAELAATRRDRDEVKRSLEEVCSTRVWRLGTLYWRLLGRLGLLPAKAGGALAGAASVASEAAGPVADGPGQAMLAVPAAPPGVEMPTRTGRSRRDPAAPGLPDVVCFSIVEWEFLFQRPQQLLSRLADLGHRVYYISQFFEPDPGAPEVHRLRSRVYTLRLRGSSGRLFSEELTPTDAGAVFESLASLREREGITAAVSVVHQPFWWPLAERARSAFGWAVLYDCMDDHGGFQTNARPVGGAERGILEGADTVVASSRVLESRIHAVNRPVELIPNGCDYEYFSSMAPRSRGGRPTVGYYGCIADWFEADLVADVAERRPDWEFLLIGPTYLADLTRLPALPNVSFPGVVPYGRLLDRIEPIDVFLLPFRRSTLTEAANPVKAYEIMATGRPLVSVPLPELEPFGDLVRFGNGPVEFERRIEEALREDGPEIVDRRRDFARRNSWDTRAARFAELVRALGAGREAGPPRPEDDA
ncbi:MAG TPA: glycosyltransferase [Thermoanaerobaculia bacterium]|nr:glycosyltransferase [Thermoanaerobaculia bacterium]